MVGHLLVLLAAHLVLTGLPGVAAALIAARLGVRSVPILLAIALAATGILAFAVFWGYYGSRVLGETLSYFVLFASILSVGWSLYGGRIDRALLRQLAIPLGLWASGSFFLIFLGFLHGGGEALQMAGTRFSWPLPSDNDIPRYVAEWFYLHGHAGHPTFPPDWLLSDRPPLQSGYVLSQHLLERGGGQLDYQVLGVVLQQLWIVGLWALLLAAGVSRRTRALAMLTVLVSAVAIVNGFFVWPKMLPTALLLAAAALILTPLWAEVRRRPAGGALIAVLFGLAMLAHGASVFGVIPLALVAAFRGLPSWRWLGVALLAGIVVMTPWSAYQKWGEPPGNRLLKYQLAGVVEIDSRGTVETLIDSYEDAGVGGTLHLKAQNFVTMAGGGPALEHAENAVDALGDGDLSLAVAETRSDFFYNLLPSMGLLLIAPFVMIAARRRGRLNPREWGLALSCFVTVAVGALAWGLLMFGNESSRTVLHQGTFLLPVLCLVAAVCGLRATFPRFAVYFLALSGTLMLALFVPALEPEPGTGYSAAAALLAALGLGGFGVLAWRAKGDGERRDAAAPPAAAP